MKHGMLAWAFMMLVLVGCHGAPVANRSLTRTEAPVPPMDTPEPDVEVPLPSAAAAQDAQPMPPCLPEEKPKLARKPKPKAVAQAPLMPLTTPPPQRAANPADAIVRPVKVSVLSVLGKKVRGQNGDDLGRVVDALVDDSGRVRIAIIQFGGFLGVGDHRIAVDWSLLKFQPEQNDTAVILDVARDKLQTVPEYKDSNRPQVLMAPPIAVAAPAVPIDPAAENKK